MLNIKEFMTMIVSAADEIIAAEVELTDIDSKFGDADHGLTMKKVMNRIKSDMGEPNDTQTFKAFLDDVSMSVMMINGGSAVPLWSTLFDGMSVGAPDKTDVDAAEFKEIFKQGYETLAELSKAKVGDKTMMDTLIPAVEAIQNAEGDIKEILEAGTKGAEAGAENSKNFVSKFGRAKSYKEQTIGTPDAGAVSMKYFFVGLNKGLQ
ncbi:dihydroxyacetone kinase subunit L [Chakrabartyella piscis]|uniref:dihydroxyacetone kinase subunit L n=1 Tax=Chakrabartyella piscis TaxID=2918914 RepID=UPI002958D424|nr:dihydroxyacetone kinase subunit L [Chakrabartyella piscis]